MLRPSALWLTFVLALAFCACKPTELSHSKAILGAMLIDGSGGPPLSDSVVVVAAGRIRAAGARATIPIPAEADKINGQGKFLVPGLVDVSSAPAISLADAIARRAPAIRLDRVDQDQADSILEAARAAGIAVIPSIATQAEVRRLVDRGASGFIGMIPDSEEPDPALVARLRALRIFFAPLLAKSGAPRNTERLFRAGVPLAVASGGGDLQREIELLVEAGVPPLDAIVAATRNGAAAIGLSDRIGTIEAGKIGNLLLLDANPGEDIRNLRRVALRMVDGEWVK